MVDHNPTRDRIWFAQLLRGVACLLVVYSHLGWGYWAGHTQIGAAGLIRSFDPPPQMPAHIPFHIKHSIQNLIPGAFGVGLFFLISGFVVPFSLDRYKAGGFLTARFFRIYPVFWCALALNGIALAIYWNIYGNGFSITPTTLLANAGLIAAYSQYRWLDSVAWTLSLEVLFYLLCTGMFLLGLFRTKRGILATAAALSLFATVTGWYYNLGVIHGGIEHWPICQLGADLCHVIYMMVGLCFHRLYKREWSLRSSVAMTLAILGLCYIPACINAMHAPQFFVLRKSYCCAYLAFGFCYLFRDYIPYSRHLNYLAEISFPLYLIHPVIGYIAITLGLEAGLGAYPSIALALLIVFAIAMAIHHFVEVPANRIGKKIADRFSQQKDREVPSRHEPSEVVLQRYEFGRTFDTVHAPTPTPTHTIR